MSLVDAHVHVWDATQLTYPWLAGAAALPERCLPSQVDRAGGQVTRMVFVEADRAPAQALDEARWVARLDWPELAGIVAHADLRAPDALSAALDALCALPGLVGIRHLLQGEHPDAWGQDALVEGLRELAGRALTFDACVRHSQLHALADLLERSPDTRVVLDHLGKPPLDAGIDSAPGRAWRRAIGRLAQLPQLHVKLSGMAAETTDAEAYARNTDAFLAAAVGAFGPTRAMIGSDWPVSARTGVGTTLADWAARIRRVTGADDAEWAALSEDTAARFYGLV